MGVDIGNGYIKIATEKGSISIPSVLGRLEGDDELGIAAKHNIFKIESKTFKEIYSMGQDILKICASSNLMTNTGEGRYTDRGFMIAIEGAIAYALSKHCSNENIFTIKVVTGVPSKEKNTALEKELIKAIEGLHSVRIDNKEIVYEASVIKVHAQPLGTLFYKFINASNQYPYDQKYIGIIDCGYGTIDIDGIKELRTVASDRDTFNDVAAFTIYTKLADYLNSVNPYAQANARSVELQFSNDIYKISDRASVDIREAKESILNEISKLLVNKLQSRWQNFTKFDNIILTGGSAYLFKRQLSEKLGDIEIVDNPQMANTIGFYLFGKLYQQ